MIFRIFTRIPADPQFGAQTANNRIASPSANGGFVENVFEELDVPGEWFHDRKGAWIYYHAPDGKRPSAAGFRAGKLEAPIRIEGRRAPVQNIRIENLAFKGTEPTFLKAPEPLLRSEWKFYRVGAITIENASAVVLGNSDFSDLGGMRSWSAAAPAKCTSRATISTPSAAQRSCVRRCSNYQVPRAGINVGDGTWGGHQITYNDVFDTVLETHRVYNVSASTRPGTSRSGMPRTSLAENWLTPRSANSAAPPCPRCRLTARKLASLTSSSTMAVRPSGST